MRADLIDISLEDYKNHQVLVLRGNFTVEQVPALREKLTMLTDARRSNYIIDLNEAVFGDDVYLELFLDILNAVKARESKMALVFSNAENTKFFARWSKIFIIHNSIKESNKNWFLANLRRHGLKFSRKTGLRISTGMAFVLVVLVFGWILTLLGFLRYQEQELNVREELVQQLEIKQKILIREMQELYSAGGPLRELGVLESKTPGKKVDELDDWVDYLESIERKRLGADEADSSQEP